MIQIAKYYLVSLILFTASTVAAMAAGADDRFIDGFPDVPFLDAIIEAISEPLVFDTPGGTVAEVGILFTISAESVFNQYGIAMEGLGWRCRKTTAKLSCLRDDSIVQLSTPANPAVSNAFILRLEPRQ